MSDERHDTEQKAPDTTSVQQPIAERDLTRAGPRLDWDREEFVQPELADPWAQRATMTSEESVAYRDRLKREGKQEEPTDGAP